jgi:hypothetical protein
MARQSTIGTSRDRTMEKGEPDALTRQTRGRAQRTLPAAISRSAITISRLSDSMSGLAPFKSCFARMDARNTRSKRLVTLSKQSSTVILAMAIIVGLALAEHKGSYREFSAGTALFPARLDIRQRSHGVSQKARQRNIYLFFARPSHDDAMDLRM